MKLIITALAVALIAVAACSDPEPEPNTITTKCVKEVGGACSE